MSNPSAVSLSTASPAFFGFTLNGERLLVEGAPATTTLLDWLRSTGRTGSKCGCDEGDCGACTVAWVDRDSQGQATYRAINSCIALLPMVAGREVVTVEGLAKPAAQGFAGTLPLHPVQAKMVEHFGSQCGYCTPGFVVALFEAYYRNGIKLPGRLDEQLCGNLCRCTGYRPIRDAAIDAIAQRSRASDLRDPFAQRLLQPVEALEPLRYAGGGELFFRPTSWAELFELKHRHADARLVAGATEIGVELNKKFKKFPVLISTEGVPELTQIKATWGEWRIGASATLTAVEEALADEFPSLTKMLAVFASRQIRNRATLGGNLVTASPIGDSAPVLLTLEASVVLLSSLGERTILLQDFFTGYRQTQLRADEIMTEIILPRTGPAAGHTRCADFLKVSHRRELDISLVAAAFCVDLDRDGVVRRARLAFGGVAVTPLRARLAEAALERTRLADSVARIGGMLSGEFKPIDDVRGSAAYRRGVMVGLWEKFVAGSAVPFVDAPLDFHGSVPWEVADASKKLRHESAVGHVTGRTLYVDDTAQRRPMLEVWPVMSPHARAKILRRDASVAKTMPGVVAVLLAEDVTGHNNVGVSRQDEPLFAQHEVSYHGQIVALVVGENQHACRAAAAVVIVDYEPLKPVLTIAQAVEEKSFHTEPHTLRRGDCAAALAAAPHRLDGEFSMGGQEHFYLETHAAWAEAGEDDTMFISSSTQHPSEIQHIVSEVLGVARHKLVVQAPRMGGGFGGKETQGNAFAAFVALAAQQTGRPVRWQLDRDLDLQLTGKRHPFAARFSVGYASDGRLRAASVDLVADGGWSLDLSQPILDRALFHLDNAYYIPAVEFSGRVVKTNVTSHTAFRGFGGPQGMLVMEEIMDRVARRLGLPPEEVRERNLYHGTGDTNTTHYGAEIGDHRLQTIWQRVLHQSAFAVRRQSINAWNQGQTGTKRGLAITPVKFGISFTLTHFNQAGALVLLYQDGTAQVNHGGTEMGQGLHTKIIGVVMRELGLTLENIRMMPTSTDKVPNTSATAASSSADLNGAAVAAACLTLRERLAPIAAVLLSRENGVPIAATEIEFTAGGARVRGGSENHVPMAEICRQAYVDRVSLSATGYYRTPGIYWDWAQPQGRPFAYYACGAAVAEVEVDGYTGMSRVTRVDIVHDVGDSLNPGIDRGQIEGGFVQGMGWLTSEELKWDAEGRLLTHSASTYQIPAISDVPTEFNVTLLPNAAQANTIHGSKAVGEPPLMLAISVREAIRDAVAAFGHGPGEVALASPATGEAVWRAIQARRESSASASIK